MWGRLSTCAGLLTRLSAFGHSDKNHFCGFMLPGFARAASPTSTTDRSKKDSTGILPQFDRLWKECIPVFDQRRVADRAQTLALILARSSKPTSSAGI